MIWSSHVSGFTRPTKDGPKVFSKAVSATRASISLCAYVDEAVHQTRVRMLVNSGWSWTVEELEEIGDQARLIENTLLAHLQVLSDEARQKEHEEGHK